MYLVYCSPEQQHRFPRCVAFSLQISQAHSTMDCILLEFSYCLFLENSKAIPRIQMTSTVARSARTRSPGWRSWSTTSTSRQIRRERRASHPWTPTTPGCFSSSSSSCSCRSWASSSSSTTTTRPSCPRRSSTGWARGSSAKRGGRGCHEGPLGAEGWMLWFTGALWFFSFYYHQSSHSVWSQHSENSFPSSPFFVLQNRFWTFQVRNDFSQLFRKDLPVLYLNSMRCYEKSIKSVNLV